MKIALPSRQNPVDEHFGRCEYVIDALRGCTGDVRTVAEHWRAGTLKDSGVACDLHEHGCRQS
jgi:predicted Fe-Mo cluster-binding NifX family protein